MTIRQAREVNIGTEVMNQYTGEITKITSKTISENGKSITFHCCNDYNVREDFGHKEMVVLKKGGIL